MYEKIWDRPDVYLVEAPVVSYAIKATNCFVVVDGDQSLVIDTASRCEKDFDRILQVIDELDLRKGDVSFFITHMHYDHMGLLDDLAERTDRVFVGRREYAQSLPDGRMRYCSHIDTRFLEEGVPLSDVRRYRKLREINLDTFRGEHNYVFVGGGDYIRIGSIELQVLETPGHTQGHLALYEPFSRLLFCGDNIVYEFSPALDCFADGSDSVAAYLGSLESMKALPFEYAMQSHGRLFQDARARIAQLEAHHAMREAGLLEAVRCCPCSCGYDLICHYADNDSSVRVHSAPISPKYVFVKECSCHLEHMVSEGILTRFRDDSGIYRYQVLR